MKKSKRMLALALLTLGFLYSCGSSNNSNSAENKDSLANNNNNTTLIIEAKSVGQVQIGQSIDKIVLSNTQKLMKEKISRNGEEGEIIEETIHTLTNNGEEMLKTIGETVIEEIAIISPNYRTKHGIGVGSSISDFMNAYHDYKIYYSYIAGNLWLETKVIDVQFKLEMINYLGTDEKLMEGDMVELKLSELKKDTKISEIRIY